MLGLKITASASNGSVLPSSFDANVPDVPPTFTFTPDAGYTLDEIVITNSFVNYAGQSYIVPADKITKVGNDYKYTFPAGVTSDGGHYFHITATFKVKEITPRNKTKIGRINIKRGKVHIKPRE